MLPRFFKYAYQGMTSSALTHAWIYMEVITCNIDTDMEVMTCADIYFIAGF